MRRATTFIRQLGADGLPVPLGCGVKTTEHPRWDESFNGIHYGRNNFGLDIRPAGYRSGLDGSFAFLGDRTFIREGTKEFYYDSSDILTTAMGTKNGISIRGVKTYTGTAPDGTILVDDYTDGGGVKYNAVVIGKQLWHTENLRATKYQNGINIPYVTDGATWAGLTTRAYCWYDNSPSTYGLAYGALYNSFGGTGTYIESNGYAVATLADWNEVINYLIETYDDITTSNVAQFLKSCRQVNHPMFIDVGLTNVEFFDTGLPIPFGSNVSIVTSSGTWTTEKINEGYGTSWFSVSPTSGQNGTSIEITCSNYPSGLDDRTGKIRFHRGLVWADVSIYQYAP